MDITPGGFDEYEERAKQDTEEHAQDTQRQSRSVQTVPVDPLLTH